MKKLIVMAIFMFVAAGICGASNYPADYAHQTARVVAKGPAIMARVSSGVMSEKFAIGYKKSGILANYDTINAVVKVVYNDNRVTETVINIGKEWNGTGFMTHSLSGYGLTGTYYYEEIKRIELAFFVGEQWDSNYGSNYIINFEDFFKNSFIFRANSDSYSTEISADCWNFIVEQMRK